jgi:hypothetical protein
MLYSSYQKIIALLLNSIFKRETNLITLKNKNNLFHMNSINRIDDGGLEGLIGNGGIPNK